jgi:hypothetical protein
MQDEQRRCDNMKKPMPIDGVKSDAKNLHHPA